MASLFSMPWKWISTGVSMSGPFRCKSKVPPIENVGPVPAAVKTR
jgi:hypothetical protein